MSRSRGSPASARPSRRAGRQAVGWLRTQTDLPICIGFGISGPDQVRQLAPVADGLIVGSAIVRRLAEAVNRPRGEVVREIGQFVGRSARRNARGARRDTGHGADPRYREARRWTSRSPSDESVVPTIRELIEREVIPLEPALLSKPFSELVRRLRRSAAKVKQMGLWAPQIPRDHGGHGA